MSTQSVVIDLPEDLYNIYKQQASQKQRTVEAEIVEAVAKVAPMLVSDKLPAELEELVAQLVFLDNAGLRRIAQSKANRKETARIEVLHFKRQDTGLDESERKELGDLMKKFDRWFVLRNEALGLLIKREQDVTGSVPKTNG